MDSPRYLAKVERANPLKAGDRLRFTIGPSSLAGHVPGSSAVWRYSFERMWSEVATGATRLWFDEHVLWGMVVYALVHTGSRNVNLDAFRSYLYVPLDCIAPYGEEGEG